MIKISELPAASALGGTEVVAGVQSSATVKILVSAIGTYVRGLFTTTPATIAEGGTGAASAAAARTALGAVGLTGNETVEGNKTFSGNNTQTGTLTMSGKSFVEAEGAAVASAASCNIWATDGNTCHITGTTQIDDFATAPQAGAWKKVIFDGALILNQSATLSLNGGGADVTTAADDIAFVYADTTTQMDVFVIRKSGAAVVPTTNTIVQVIEATPITTVVTCSTILPLDDTIPQNTEGTEVITVTITPTSATNRLRLEFGCFAGLSGSDNFSVAVFQDTTANALAAASNFSAGNREMFSITHEMAAGTTSATTFKIRLGPAGANTAYVNAGTGGVREFGGVAAARLRVTEIKV